MPTFTADQIIALAGVIAGVIIALATVIAGQINTRAAIKGKLSEIAFEKRLAAFSEIYDAITNVNLEIRTFALALDVNAAKHEVKWEEGQRLRQHNERLIMDRQNDYFAALQKYKSVYAKHRVYLPPHIDRLLSGYAQELNDSIPIFFDETTVISKQSKENIDSITRSIVNEIHKFVGLE